MIFYIEVGWLVEFHEKMIFYIEIGWLVEFHEKIIYFIEVDWLVKYHEKMIYCISLVVVWLVTFPNFFFLGSLLACSDTFHNFSVDVYNLIISGSRLTRTTCLSKGHTSTSIEGLPMENTLS